jgi:hypothetical protein
MWDTGADARGLSAVLSLIGRVEDYDIAELQAEPSGGW